MNQRNAVAVEICVQGIASALAAAEGGASRVELCEDLRVGGVTPSAGMVAVACQRLSIPVHVLIRPRGGDFIYSEPELAMIARDLAIARDLGAAGVVLGILQPDGTVDRDRMAKLVEEARPLPVTFHKAFDATRDPWEALDTLLDLGIDRVLTSGHAATAVEGRATLEELHRRAAGKVVILAGGSVSLSDLPALFASGLREIHSGSAVLDPATGIVDARRVQALVEQAHEASLIFHITTRQAWDHARSTGVYLADSLAREGFIHASTRGQVLASARRFFAGQADLVVLKIDPTKLSARLDWARSPDSELPFPHVHGPIESDAVVAVEPLELDADGRFHWGRG
jgi:copper homeostasis protein